MDLNRHSSGSVHSANVMGGWHKSLPGRFVAILALLMAGIGTGAVVGSVQAAQASPEAQALQATLGADNSEPLQVASLTVEDPGKAGEESAASATAPAPAKKATARRAPAAGATSAVYAPVVARVPSLQQSVDCERLDDKKIYWLLDLVAKAKASNPDQAAVADHIDAQLRSKLGQNICAEEAQIYINAMCGDPGVRNFMDLMVKELPFFVRPLVGDPCSHDLVAAAERWL